MIDGGKLDAFAKARTMKQAKTIMLTALAHDLENRLGDKEARHMHLQIAHTENYAAAEELRQELHELIPRRRFGWILCLSALPAILDRELWQ